MGKGTISFGINTGGFCGSLTLLFIALKLIGCITWGWGWVLSPLWIPVALLVAGIIVFFGIALLVIFIRAIYEDWSMKKSKGLRK